MSKQVDLPDSIGGAAPMASAPVVSGGAGGGSFGCAWPLPLWWRRSIAQEPTPTLLAYDCSGSTGGCPPYHALTKQLVSGLPADAGIVLWDDQVQVADRARLAAINNGASGFGGTYPDMLAQHIVRTRFHGHLVLITDGQVDGTRIDKCDVALKAAAAEAAEAADAAAQAAWRFASVTVHLVHTGGAVNASVSCPFTRGSPHRVLQYARGVSRLQDGVVAASVTADDLAILHRLHTITTLADYHAAADMLDRVVAAATMGTTGDPALYDAILAMKKRVVTSAATAAAAAGPAPQLAVALTAGDTEAAVRAAAMVVRDYFTEHDAGWSARVNRLISMCEGALRSAFDLSALDAAIHSDRVRRAAALAPTAATAAPLMEENSVAAAGMTRFACPLSLDDEADVVLLVNEGAEGEVGPAAAVLAGLDKDTVNNLIDCPLNLFRYPAVLSRFLARLDHGVGLRSLRRLAEAAAAEGAGTPLRSPLTRRTVIGGLCLSPSREHATATTWTLACMLTGSNEGKMVGNPALWFACVWLAVERGNCEYLQPLLPQLRAHMKWRLQNETTFMSLSGLPEFVTTLVPVGAAAWTCASWPAIAAAVPAVGGSPLHPRSDCLRQHMQHTRELYQLCDLAGYALPAGVKEHAQKDRALLELLRRVKIEARDGSSAEGYISERIRALHQRAVYIDRSRVGADVREREHVVPAWVPVDGPAPEEQQAAVLATLPEYMRRLGPQVLTGLAALVHPLLSAAAIALPMGWTPPPPDAAAAAAAAVRNWAYPLATDPAPEPKILVTVSPTTCRPLYAVKRAKPATAPAPAAAAPGVVQSWREEAGERWRVPAEGLISLHRRYADFVCKYGRYPANVEEMMVFLHNRYNLPPPPQQEGQGAAVAVAVAEGEGVGEGAGDKVRSLPGAAVGTLPARVTTYMEWAFESFVPVCAEVAPAEFVRRFQRHVSIPSRTAAEAADAVGDA